MNSLAEHLIASLQGDTSTRGPERELLARAGDPEPEQAAEAFRTAALDTGLAAGMEHWVPALLQTARPGYGASCLAELFGVRRAAGSELDPERLGALPAVLGSSLVLARTLRRHPEWADDLLDDLPAPPGPAPIEADWGTIRRGKYRGLLRIAARDLAGRPFEASLAELSDLADRCLDAALRCAADETGLTAPALFALGKLGGRELNFSSDVDLLFVYSTRPDAAETEQIRDCSSVVRAVKKGLETPSSDGFAYRVDLDLRPEGRTGVLVNSVDAALGFYEAFGAEWERQMLIRLRGVAGPAEALDAFSQGITPFVYRRLIDPAVMTNVRKMKVRIEEERLQAGRDLEADLKEGPGGIRDVEFIVQSLVLFHGGHHPALRTGNVLDTLTVLRELDLLPEEITASLSSCYLWLRRAEHAVQLAEEQQTARFPRDPEGQTGTARRMGYAQPEGRQARDNLLEDWVAVRTEVRAHFDALVLSEDT